jgi:hypothetical protein
MFETCITKSNVPFENERHFSLKDTLASNSSFRHALPK